MSIFYFLKYLISFVLLANKVYIIFYKGYYFARKKYCNTLDEKLFPTKEKIISL